MGRREESCPNEMKIKLKRDSTNIYAGKMCAKGCLTILQTICAVRGMHSEFA